MAENVILTETTYEGFAPNEDYGAYLLNINPVPFALTLGETYKVMWDEVAYECVAISTGTTGDGSVETLGLGNLGAVGIEGGNSDAPFIIGWSPAGVTLFSFDANTSHTVGIDQLAVETQEGIILKDRKGEDVPYYGIETLTLDTTTEGKQQTFTKGVAVEGLEIVPDFSTGDMAIVAAEGTLVKSAVIRKPEGLSEENIRYGTEVAGIVGTLIGDTEEVTVELDMADGDQVIEPSAENKVISKVTVKKPEALTPANIAEGVNIGGVVGKAGAYTVRVIDYDGTILDERNLDEGYVYTLPNAPSHDRLVFEGWSSPVALTGDTLTMPGHDLTIGATYHTASGATEIDIEVTAVTGLTVTFKSVLTGMTSIDWGDGTTDATLTHTYAIAGEYTVKIYGLTAIAAGSSSGGIVAPTNYTVKNVFLGESVKSIGAYAFADCYSLTKITIPSSVTSIEARVLIRCKSLKAVIIPSGVTSIGTYAFYACNALMKIVIPSDVTSIGSNAFASCYALAEIAIPSSVTSIGTYAFSNCTALTKLTIPSSVMSIGSRAFQQTTALKECDFSDHTVVPTASTYLFLGTNQLCKIKVKSSLLSSWKAATNWTTYANYMVGV